MSHLDCESVYWRVDYNKKPGWSSGKYYEKEKALDFIAGRDVPAYYTLVKVTVRKNKKALSFIKAATLGNRVRRCGWSTWYEPKHMVLTGCDALAKDWEYQNE